VICPCWGRFCVSFGCILLFVHFTLVGNVMNARSVSDDD
jgi:hypothetical protein